MGIELILGAASTVAGVASAKSGADAQVDSGNAQIGLRREIYDDQTERFEPYSQAGGNALSALMYEMDLGPRPTFGGDPLEVVAFSETIPGGYNPAGGSFTSAGRDSILVPQYYPDETRTRFRVGEEIFDDRDAADAYAQANPTGGEVYAGFTGTPGYDFRLQEGLDAVEASVAGRRGLNSGNAMKALTEYGQDYASSEYTNHLNRLFSVMGTGQASAGMQANAGQNFATGASNALANIGNAQAAGAIGMGNAVQGGINNLANSWGYQKGQGNNNWLFGGNSWG